MKFSTRTLYGLKAILVLACRYGEGSLAVSQIAKKEGISVAYLEQILNALKKKGLLKSVRGPQGGYALAKKPADISLESLLYALEGKPLLENGQNVDLSPEKDEIGIAHNLFWKRFKSSIEKALGEVSLKELIDEARRFKKSKGSTPYTFHI